MLVVQLTVSWLTFQRRFGEEMRPIKLTTKVFGVYLST